ncbi:hypothetical protein HDV62DRAFT_7390 [Trichoderma sp. SZMC 28011]
MAHVVASCVVGGILPAKCQSLLCALVNLCMKEHLSSRWFPSFFETRAWYRAYAAHMARRRITANSSSLRTVRGHGTALTNDRLLARSSTGCPQLGPCVGCVLDGS